MMGGTLPTALAAVPQRRLALAIWLGGIVWTLFWYHSTLASMVGIWYRSETFNHAFLVAPISAWLVWRKRSELSKLPIRPVVWPILPMAAFGFSWLLGEFASVNALTHLSLVATLVLVTVALLGTQVAAAIAFPLAFLFFMVPIGEFALPQLMEWTAGVTVLALRLTGIPVYQDGLHFVIPSGNWSVVEACSGVRYLIASVCVGSLFAYLNYASPRRRIAFIAVSFLVPIIANWVRAYLIVMIGHLSSGKLATGVDHLIYGWLFFGLVVAIMFAVGARWKEESPQIRRPLSPVTKTGKTSIALSAFVALTAATLVATPPSIIASLDQPANEYPIEPLKIGSIAGWSETTENAPWKPAYENADESSFQSFRQGESIVGLHVLYYRNQNYHHKLVSSTNVLVRSNDSDWSRISTSSQTVTVNGKQLAVRTSLLRSRAGRSLTVWHWYWINGRTTESDALAKLYTALGRLASGRDAAAGVFVFNFEEAASDDATVATFVRALHDPLDKTLNDLRQQ